MRISMMMLGVAVLTMPVAVVARGHHGPNAAAPHGHSINAWMGSHRPRLR